MRLSFPNGDHPDVLIAEGSLRLGASVDNDVMLPELRERHARLTRDARGIVLEVIDASARAHVNARPVREKAFVRYGDTLCLDAVTIAISEQLAESGDVPSTPSVARRHGSQRGVLRGMSGVWFGKSIALGDELFIGTDQGGELRIATHRHGEELARIGIEAGFITLRSSEPGGSAVNGLRRDTVVLQSGDQLSFGRDRFVVECCSVPAQELDVIDVELPLPEAPVEQGDEDSATPGTAIWWLIAAAALIGTLLAVVLANGV